MPQSRELAAEFALMRRIEAAFRDAEALPEKARARVLAWARDTYLDPEQAK